MPPKASASRKKTWPEVQYDELQRAMLARVAAQPSAEQPSAQQQPSAVEHQPSAAEHQPSAVEQPSHSPVLPLVLPTPSIHSTSGSTASTNTGAGLPERSIPSRNVVAEATVSGSTLKSL